MQILPTALTIGTMLALAFVPGCGMLDNALTSRAEDINISYGQFLNNEILRNIVLAGNGEPPDFVALAKYTGAETFSLTSNLFTAVWAPRSTHPMETIGPNTALAQAQNSFDINSLETKEFYTTLMTRVDLSHAALLFGQGFPRELLFYSLLEAVRVTAPDGVVYEYRNDPADDQWTDDSSHTRQNPSETCAEWARPVTETGPSYYHPPFGKNGLWSGAHRRDCYFHKFDYFVRLAWKYGITEESVTVDNPNWSEKSASEPKTIQKWQICYDPAIAQEHGVTELPEAVCGSGKPHASAQEFTFSGGVSIKSIGLMFRSPFGIFRYLGRILATHTADRVRLKLQDIPMSEEDTKLLDLTLTTGSGCFAKASHNNITYCVPATGASNTKRVFTVLRALLALNTSAASLNPTATVRVTP